MKRPHLTLAIALAAALSITSIAMTGCTRSGQDDHPANHSDQSAKTTEKTVLYTCPMHPEVLQDKPGDCPKCGMKLVEKH